MEEKNGRERKEDSAGERERVEWKRRMQGKGKKSQQGRGRGWNGREGCKERGRRVSKVDGEGGVEEKVAREGDKESSGERVEWKRRMQGKGKKSQEGRGRGWNGRERCKGMG